jgi:hypothetical protein
LKKVVYSWLNLLLGIIGSLMFLPVLKSNTSDIVFAVWMVLLNFAAYGILLANGMKSTSMRYLIYYEDVTNNIGHQLRQSFKNKVTFDTYLYKRYKQVIFLISIVFWLAAGIYFFGTDRISGQFLLVNLLVFTSMLIQLFSGRWSSYLEAWNKIEEYQESLLYGSY